MKLSTKTWVVVGSLTAALGCGSASNDATDNTDNTDNTTPDAEPTPDADTTPDAAVAPEITALSPASALVHGGETITITGDNLTGTTAVTFGGVAATDVTVVDDQTVTVTAPEATAVVADVELTTGAGTASEAHRYGGLYLGTGAGGRNGDGSTYGAGGLYLVDPRDAFALPIGGLVDGGGITYGITGMTFDDAGTLWASEATQYSALRQSSLLSIDSTTGAVTAVGFLQEAGGGTQHDAMPSLAFTGGTLFGWTEDSDSMSTINPATGEVTVLGGGVGSAGSGIAADDAGTLYAAPQSLNGSLFTVDPATGVATPLVTMTGASNNVRGLTFFRGTLYAIEKTVPEMLCTIDVATGAVTQIAALPVGAEDLASLELAATAMAPAPAVVAQPLPAQVGVASRVGCAATELRVGGTKATVTATPVALRTLAGAAVLRTVTTCDGEQTFDAATLAGASLKRNQRGEVKLIDATGHKLASGVLSLR